MQEVYFWAGYIIILAYSIIFHEIAHAVAALWSGDDTAKLMNRITLNPIPHIDPFMTILMPGILIFLGSPVVFGMAKPVPVNPLRFRRPVRDDLFVSVAGVLTNLIIAFIFALLLHLATGMNKRLFEYAVLQNVVLAVFNLVPIPPLDGSHVFKYVLPREARARYEALGFHGLFLVVLFLVFAGDYLYYADKAVASIIALLSGHGWNYF